MQAKQLIVLAAIAFAGGAALADDITFTHDSAVSTRTRAEVKAELLAARRSAGFVSSIEEQMAPPAAASALTREQVRTEIAKTPRDRVVRFEPAA